MTVSIERIAYLRAIASQSAVDNESCRRIRNEMLDLVALLDELTALKQENAALRKDADLWRRFDAAMRRGSREVGHGMVQLTISTWEVELTARHPNGVWAELNTDDIDLPQSLEAAIDAAMEAK